MELTQAKYINRTESASAFARRLGRDDRTLVSDGITYFWAQPGITPAPQDASFARIEFHEAAHLLSNTLFASFKSEEIAAIYECVWMRGSYKEWNKDDDSLFALPVKAIPSEAAVDVFVKNRIKKINRKSEANYEPDYQYLSDTDITAHYRHAVKGEEFFRAVTDGRALYQLSVRELMRLPLVCLGVVRKQAPGFVVERILDTERQMILDHLNANRECLLSRMYGAAPRARTFTI